MGIPKKTRIKKCPTCGQPEEVPNGRYLMWVRLKAEQTLRDVAKAAGVSHTYVADIERGVRSCSSKVLKVYDRLEKEVLA